MELSKLFKKTAAVRPLRYIKPHSIPMARFIDNYGDMLFDLCCAVLWNTAHAQSAFRIIIKDIRKNYRVGDHDGPTGGFVDYERAWILKIAALNLVPLSRRYGIRLTAAEQIKLDATPELNNRIKRFDAYFNRLEVEDKLILLLRDKYGLPYNEISTALLMPEGSIKVRRQQALRTLEEWLWDNA